MPLQKPILIKEGGKLKQLITVKWVEDWETGGHTYHCLHFWEGKWIHQYRDYCNPRWCNQESEGGMGISLSELEGEEISELKKKYGNEYEFVYEEPDEDLKYIEEHKTHEDRIIEKIKSGALMLDELLGYLKYKRKATEEDNIVEEPDYESPGDYEIGAEVRAAAAEKAGRQFCNNGRVVAPLIEVLESEMGDEAGHTFDNAYTFHSGSDKIRMNAMQSLVYTKARKAIPVLEKLSVSGHSRDTEGKMRSYSTKECLGCRSGECSEFRKSAKMYLEWIKFMRYDTLYGIPWEDDAT